MSVSHRSCSCAIVLLLMFHCIPLLQTLNLLPEDALVGLVTFGTNVAVHELGFSECPKSYVFRGDKEYPAAKVQDLLAIAPAGALKLLTYHSSIRYDLIAIAPASTLSFLVVDALAVALHLDCSSTRHAS